MSFVSFRSASTALLVGAAHLLLVAVSRAEFVLETADLGATGQVGGYRIAEDQFLGARFSLDQAYAITAVGGHVANAGGSFFMAVVELSAPGALPQGDPLNLDEVRAVATTSFDGTSQDLLLTFPVVLPAGDYALIFGSGLYGAGSPNAAMPGNNIDLPGASRFYWDGIVTDQWIDGGVEGGRFVVLGAPIPEPVAGAYLLLSALVLLWGRRRG